MKEFKGFLEAGDEVVAASISRTIYSNFIYVFTKLGRIYRFNHIDNTVERLV